MDFRLLGPLEVESGGSMVPIKGGKERGLLALLLFRANRPVSRDLLIDELWGEHPPATARHTLEAYVSRLRGALAGAGNGKLIESQPGGYRICVEDDQLDVLRFERLLEEGRSALADGAPQEAEEKLAAALALWRGPVLADLAYEAFTEAEARRLEELRLVAVEARLEAALGLGRDAELVGELQSLVARHPLRERLRAQLMLALYRSGRQADALAVYREGRRLLVDELGIEPSRELQELEQAILRQEPQLQPSAPAPGVSPVAPHPVLRTRPPLRRPVLVAVAAAGAAIVAVAAIVGLWPRGGARGIRIAHDGVAWIDPADGRVARAIVTSTGTAPSGVAAGDGTVWTLDAVEGLALRLDPHSGAVVQTLRIGTDAGGITVGGGSAWVTSSSDDSVVRINLKTNQVVQRIPVGNTPTGIAYGLGSIWVAAAGERTVARLDARTGEVTARVPTGLPGTGVAVGAGFVWTTHASAGSVSQIDPQTNEVVRTIAVGNGPGAIGAAGGTVWVANSLDGTVSRIDPGSGKVTATVFVGQGPVGIAGAGDSVWVANEASATLVALDARTARLTRTVPLGAEPRGLAAAGDVLAVSVRATAGDHRGGVLRLAEAYWLDSIDPALAYTTDSWEVLSLTNDGLVSFRRVGGPEGATLVPGLAEALPSATTSGTSYTFRLRPRLRYSTGERVRASDVLRSLERLFRLHSPRLDYYAGLVGGAACLAHPARCDLSRGVRTNDAARTVTFHLVRPDPEFLYKLALPFASVLPPSTPMRPAGGRPLAATGPYVLRHYRRSSFELVRNPMFRPYSADRPASYPDRIVFRHIAARPRSRARAAGLVERDRLDVAFLRENLAQLQARYASRIHLLQQPTTIFLLLNLKRPPFDRLAVRRALSYAVDRRAARSSPTGEPTCQLLPPSFPDYRPYCRYTRGAGPRWRGPDLRRARELVAESGTRGMRVTVWRGEEIGLGDRALPAVVRALRRLGYRAEGRVLPYETVHARRRRIQAEVMGWAADYPAPSNFLSLLRCRSGEALFCDPGLERTITRLTALQATDPARADTEWAALDRQIVDRALAVPLFNPRSHFFVSDRVRNFQPHPVYSTLLEQIRVR